MLNDQLVSVIMPAYNAQNYIGESIQSVIRQTYTNWELIIVDDGSIDSTAEIIKQFQLTDPRIKYIYQQNGKQGKARNTAIGHSNGEYIAFLDADDWWVEDKLAVQMSILSSDENIDLLFSQGYYFNDGEIKEYNVNINDLWDDTNLKDFIHYNQIPILSVIVKRDALLSVKCFVENDQIQNVEDYYLWLILLNNNFKFKSISDRLFYYRLHSEQNTYLPTQLKVPVIKMFGLFYSSTITNTTRLYKYIIERIKWSLFDKDMNESVFELITLIAKKEKIAVYFLLNIASLLGEKLRFKAAFKLAAMI